MRDISPFVITSKFIHAAAQRHTELIDEITYVPSVYPGHDSDGYRGPDMRLHGPQHYSVCNWAAIARHRIRRRLGRMYDGC